MSEATTEAAQAIDLSQFTVMVVDDQPFVRNMIKQQLRQLGCSKVHEYSDGQSALEAIGSVNPDVVLCDINMVGMNGLEVLEHVRTGEGLPHELPFIFLTNETDPEMVEKAVGLKASAYLIKPASLDILQEQISKVLRAAGKV